jgi:hypothetical protein
MKLEKEIQALENVLDGCKEDSPELNNFSIESVGGDKNKFALAEKIIVTLPNGSVQEVKSSRTDFMNYKEMNQFLRGYNFKATNRFQ